MGWTNIFTKGSLPFPDAEIDETDWHTSFVSAREKYGAEPFFFGQKGDKILILPNHLFDEIKDLPDDQLSFWNRITNLLFGAYSGVGAHRHLHGTLAKTLRTDFTRKIPVDILQEEVRLAIDREIGECADWTSIDVLEKTKLLTHSASARVLMGKALCRDPEWQAICKGFSESLVRGILDTQYTAPYLRPFRTPFLHSIRHVLICRRRAQQKLNPLVQQVWKDMQSHRDSVPTSEEPDEFRLNFVRSILKDQPANDERIDASSVTDTALFATFAAIHTSSFALTNLIYDLATRPCVVEEIRAEIDQNNNNDDQITKPTIQKLRKLDSAMKESMRIYPIAMAPIHRTVTSPTGITLSNGTHLPNATVFAVSSPQQTSTLSEPLDRSLDEYHPFRYVDTNQHFVSTSINNTAFGHGRLACPGRFFAMNVIKVIMIELLERYDFALGPNGEHASEGYKRPETRAKLMGYYPDEDGRVYFRRRSRNQQRELGPVVT